MNAIPQALAVPAAMAPGAALRSCLRPLSKAAGWRLFGLRGLTLRRLAWTLALAAGFAVWSATANVFGEQGLAFSMADLVDSLCYWFVRYSITFLPPITMLTLADNLPLRGSMRGAVFGVAIVLGAVAMPPLIRVLNADDCSACTSYVSWAAQSWNLILTGCVYSTIFATAYLTRRRDRELAGALHASHLARNDARRQALEADLQVLQARVEPSFLFGALRDVAALYASEPRAGDHLLDQLIQYLRAALPQMRVSGSTVAQEVSLLRAYLNILALHPSRKLDVAFRVAKGLDDASVPPLMLAPLVTPPAATPGSASRWNGSIRIDIRSLDGRLRFAIAAAGDMARSMADSPAVDEVRGRLAALYGQRAMLVVDRVADDHVQLIVEIPHERAHRGNR